LGNQAKRSSSATSPSNESPALAPGAKSSHTDQMGPSVRCGITWRQPPGNARAPSWPSRSSATLAEITRRTVCSGPQPPARRRLPQRLVAVAHGVGDVGGEHAQVVARLRAQGEDRGGALRRGTGLDHPAQHPGRALAHHFDGLVHGKLASVARAYHAVAVLALGALVAAEAVAAPGFVGGAGTSAADAALVARGGEVYTRDAAGTWRRRAGGVAAELHATWGRVAGELVAVGARAPAYRYDGETWSSFPGAAGGPAVLAGRDAPRPGLAIGRRVYVLESGKDRWTALPAAPGRVTSLWTRGPREALIVVDGKLLRLAGGWKPLPILETVIALGGAEPVALGAEGGVYLVGARATGARRAAVDTALAGFRPRAVLGGVLVGDAALARLGAGKVVPIGAAPEGGVAALIELGDGTLLAATRAGKVFVGRPGSWTEEPVDDAPPPSPGKAVAPPATIPAEPRRDQ
jgi:hypothetical protein